MICIVCMKSMTPIYHEITKESEGKSEYIITSYKCYPCRNMLERIRTSSQLIEDPMGWTTEMREDFRLFERYCVISENKLQIEEGYSFP